MVEAVLNIRKDSIVILKNARWASQIVLSPFAILRAFTQEWILDQRIETLDFSINFLADARTAFFLVHENSSLRHLQGTPDRLTFIDRVANVFYVAGSLSVEAGTLNTHTFFIALRNLRGLICLVKFTLVREMQVKT